MCALNLFDSLSEVVYLREVENLCFLVLCQVTLTEKLQALSWCHWQFDLLVVYALVLAPEVGRAVAD